jgi:hypothetical protein
MKRIFPTIFIAVTVCFSIAIISGCGQASHTPTFNKNGPGVTVNTTSGGGCSKKHEMKGFKPAWSYSYCKEIETLHVDQNTENGKKEVLNDRPMNRGMISFKITGMTNNKVTARETFGIIFMANGNGNGEANWQWMSYHVGGDAIQSRIIVQRFDGTCPDKCEHSVITDDLQFKDVADVFQFDCQWNAQLGDVSCDITKPAEKTFKIHLANQTQGLYNSIRYIGLGREAFHGSYPGYDGTLSDIVITIFD